MQIKKLSKIALYIFVGALCVWLSLRFLAPFLVALLLAMAAERPIEVLQQKARLSRPIASFLCVLGILAALCAAAFFVCRLLCTQAIDLVRKMPSFAASLAAPIARLEKSLYEIASKLPDGLGTGLRAGIQSLFESGSLIGEKVYGWLFGAASSVFDKLPVALFSVFTAVLAAFMLSAELPQIKVFIKQKLPGDKREKILHLVRHFRDTLGHWLKAEVKISAIMTVIIIAGLLILSVNYAVLFGLFAGIVDALPIFGAGAVLVPWAVILLIRGDVQKAIGMLILFIITCIARQALEPKLIGSQMGVSPLVMLGAIYVGFLVFGVYGMLLFPIGVIVTKSFVGQNRL